MKATRYVVMAVLVLPSASAQEKADFSGHYLLNLPKTSKHETAPPPSYLRVTQSEKSLEATFSEAGQERTARYFLDGSPSVNITSSGARSTDVARLKGKALLIESIISVRSTGTVLHVKQKWELSRDSQKLTIHSTNEGTSLGITIELPSADEVYSRQP